MLNWTCNHHYQLSLIDNHCVNHWLTINSPRPLDQRTKALVALLIFAHFNTDLVASPPGHAGSPAPHTERIGGNPCNSVASSQWEIHLTKPTIGKSPYYGPMAKLGVVCKELDLLRGVILFHQEHCSTCIPASECPRGHPAGLNRPRAPAKGLWWNTALRKRNRDSTAKSSHRCLLLIMCCNILLKNDQEWISKENIRIYMFIYNNLQSFTCNEQQFREGSQRYNDTSPTAHLPRHQCTSYCSHAVKTKPVLLRTYKYSVGSNQVECPKVVIHRVMISKLMLVQTVASNPIHPNHQRMIVGTSNAMGHPYYELTSTPQKGRMIGCVSQVCRCFFDLPALSIIRTMNHDQPVYSANDSLSISTMTYALLINSNPY